jgi:hypothetical protein
MDKLKLKEKMKKMNLMPEKILIPLKGTSSGTQSGGQPDASTKQSPFEHGQK